MTDFIEFNNDQRRESVNSAQRYSAFRQAQMQADGYKGSLTWHEGVEGGMLVRSYYDKAGIRRQKAEGPRSPKTEEMKLQWERGREAARERLGIAKEVLERQAAINRAVNIGRVPLLSARIIRAIDAAGLLGQGVRILGTHALYAYEAQAGVLLDASLLATQDIDLLFDARRSLRLAMSEQGQTTPLMQILRKVDHSFKRLQQTFRASNAEGFMVDLIAPERNPPWGNLADSVGGEGDLVASPIHGLVWHENSPAFETIAIDEKGMPLRMVTVDPRLFAIHKFWLSQRIDREPVKRRRDSAQARAVAELLSLFFSHLPFDGQSLRMMPKDVVEAAFEEFRQK